MSDVPSTAPQYFPDGPDQLSGITIRHALTHTSGIQNHFAIPGYLSVFESTLFFEDTPARDELIRMFSKQAPGDEPA